MSKSLNNPKGPLWAASATIAKEFEELAIEFLTGFFEQGVASYLDMESGKVTLSIYLRERSTWTGKLEELRANWPKLAIGAVPEFDLRRVKQEDWAESWKRHFKPMRFGSRVWVRPSWCKVALKRDQIEVVIDPGLSFGTGQHPTTGFCLTELVRLRKSETRQSFLDIGTGSGILAITAAKLGYGPIDAFDFDPDAVRIAGANARTNKTWKVKAYVADVTDDKTFRGMGTHDVVCANLISNLIVQRCDAILRQVAEGGVFIAAGILAAEFNGVEKVLNGKGWVLVRSKIENEWRSGTFRKKAGGRS